MSVIVNLDSAQYHNSYILLTHFKANKVGSRLKEIFDI
jgi:hypothetical protein